MIVFLDFEASSLSKKSYPVEVAWVFEDGRSASRLLRPAPDWTDWSADAERIHGLSRLRLEAEGVSVEAVAREMVDQLTGHQLYASAPSWDGKWLSVLLRAGGFPRHALRLAKSDEAFLAAMRAKAPAPNSEADLRLAVADLIEQTEPRVPAHRALPDALVELDRLRRARDCIC